MSRRYVVAATAIGVATAAYILLARPRQLSWGATDHESDEPLPGDDLITDADLTATRAITIRTPADQVWPWIAQLGQGRGGFYSYDFSKTWSAATYTAPIASCPTGRTSSRRRNQTRSGARSRVALLERRRSLVLGGGIPMGNTTPPYDFTWAFALRDQPDETTRLLVRE